VPNPSPNILENLTRLPLHPSLPPSLPPSLSLQIDSSVCPSLGKGLCYLDPIPLPPSRPPSLPPSSITLQAYRSESQIGFWPLKGGREGGREEGAVDVPAIPRSFR